jgi:hypothetical protein
MMSFIVFVFIFSVCCFDVSSYGFEFRNGCDILPKQLRINPDNGIRKKIQLLPLLLCSISTKRAIADVEDIPLSSISISICIIVLSRYTFVWPTMCTVFSRYIYCYINR